MFSSVFPDVTVLVGLLVALPLGGVAASGEDVGRYLEFPPTTRYVDHAGFSWPAFLALAVPLGVLIAVFVYRVSAARAVSGAAAGAARRFPWWGWVGAALTGATWAVAWTRFDAFDPVQRYTFTPLWLGYILTVNALTVRRKGRSLMTAHAWVFLGLFPLSGAFWWFFEYLNRFVQNWAYAGLGDLGALEYFLFATPPFSTVLPAVAGTAELIGTSSRLQAALARPSLQGRSMPPASGWVLIAAAGGGLAAIGVWPDYLFPLVWVAPLLVLTAIDLIRGRDTVLTAAGGEGWGVWTPCLAALICGFFWETWNYGSLAHWEYVVPFVDRWQLFEMPAVGYAGYLPFGLECVVAARLLPGWRAAWREPQTRGEPGVCG